GPLAVADAVAGAGDAGTLTVGRGQGDHGRVGVGDDRGGDRRRGVDLHRGGTDLGGQTVLGRTEGHHVGALTGDLDALGRVLGPLATGELVLHGDRALDLTRGAQVHGGRVRVPT